MHRLPSRKNGVRPAGEAGWIGAIGSGDRLHALARAAVREAACGALCLAPILVALAWGPFFDSDAHLTLAAARNVAAGRAWAYGLSWVEPAALPRAPLYTLALALLARLGAPLSHAALLLSAAGWSALALALCRFARLSDGPLAGAAVALLAVLHPLALSSLGAEAAWTVALFWAAAIAAWRGRWLSLDVLVALMLLTRLDLATVGGALLLGGLQWRETRRFPLRLCALLTAVLSGAVLMAARASIGVSAIVRLAAPGGLRAAEQLLEESEFYWLAPPLVALGLLALRARRPQAATRLWAILACAMLAWVPLALAGAGTVAEVGAAATVLLLAGLGAVQAARWVRARARVQIDRRALTAGLAALTLLPLIVAQSTSLATRFRERPAARRALDQHASAWLSAHSEPGEVVLGPPWIEVPLDRPALLWDGRSGLPAELSEILAALRANPPLYVVSMRTVAWDRLIRSGWYVERYAPVETVRSAYEPVSPLTVWRYRPHGSAAGPLRPADAVLADGVRLVGYRYWPQQIAPGDAVYVTLSLQSSQPITTAFRTVLRVLSPLDGRNWAQQDLLTPQGMSVDWWRPGQSIDERYVLTTTVDIPVGAYHLDAFVLNNQSAAQVLGYVSVPWRGATAGLTDVVGATFADQIALLGYETAGIWTPGAENSVTLYWKALRPPEDDYTVFVHLVGPGARYVTGHDGPPMQGRYPTLAWLPGDVIPDAHALALGPDVAPGTYWVKAGMYRKPSMERLSVRSVDGALQPDGILELGPIQVR
jgi:hypothetical protein